jgi:hypothetical protein
MMMDMAEDFSERNPGELLAEFIGDFCFALLRMRTLSISYAESRVVISCGKVDYDKSGKRHD